ncbi:pimeloyl-ACP methyl ester carboxylesterase [Nocardioides salarius]|uniref:Pimeloyl-ACP methyl ester carboxylesterase n=1 Tax=Nocardioides salarius TaxID=374513 RepID=A0ABS2M748_9ACTN|nr:alpha/beta hydrolase [Nocardioides salarius]MBM7507006.1 pimeloyl-ACP methyl ester carboxylesterase [Nocardioides salarius]
MSTTRARTSTPALAFDEVLSDDGTRLRAWTNDQEGVIDGPTVVLCNGLGTNAYAWPALLDPGCGVRVVSWNHRGVGGSERPSDRSHCRIEDVVDDGLSVMDHFGIDRAVLMGWSIGVNTMFELALRHPERVSGLFAVAGVPGDTFATMLAPLRVPRPLARLLTVNAARAAKQVGCLLSPVASRLPVGPLTITALSHSGFMLPVRDPEMAALAVREFLSTPLDWYFHLALRTSEHARVSLRHLTVPVTFVAGTYDLLAGARDMASAAARVPGATYHELPGTHFLSLEHPDEVHRLLLELLERAA